jgi:hypothetical protein
VIVDRKYTVKFEEHPLYFQDDKEGFHYAVKPFIKFTDVPVQYECYGIGEIEMLMYMQNMVNDFTNMRADGAMFAVSPVFQVVSSMLVNKNINNITFAPGSIVETEFTGGAQAISPLQKDTSYLLAQNEIDDIVNRMRNQSGVQIPLSGGQGEIRETATQFVGKANEAYSRVKLKITINENTANMDQARLQFLIEKQFTDTEVLAQLFDIRGVQAFAKITPNQLKGDYMFQLQPLSQYGMRGVNAQRLTELAQQIQNMPQVESRVNFSNLLQAIIDAYGIKDTDIIIPENQAQANILADKMLNTGLDQATARAGAALSPTGQNGGPGPTLGAPGGGGDMEALMQQIRSDAGRNAPRMG